MTKIQFRQILQAENRRQVGNMIAVGGCIRFRIPGPRPEVQVGQAGGVLQTLQAADAGVTSYKPVKPRQVVIGNGIGWTLAQFFGDNRAQVAIGNRDRGFRKFCPRVGNRRQGGEGCPGKWHCDGGNRPITINPQYAAGKGKIDKPIVQEMHGGGPGMNVRPALSQAVAVFILSLHRASGIGAAIVVQNQRELVHLGHNGELEVVRSRHARNGGHGQGIVSLAHGQYIAGGHRTVTGQG